MSEQEKRKLSAAIKNIKNRNLPVKELEKLDLISYGIEIGMRAAEEEQEKAEVTE